MPLKDFEVTREDNCIWLFDNRGLTAPNPNPIHLDPEQAGRVAYRLQKVIKPEIEAAHRTAT